MLKDLRLDEETWNGAGPDRRREWTVVLSDLIEDGDFGFEHVEAFGLITSTEEAILFEFLNADGAVFESRSLPRAAVAHAVADYVRVIARLGEASTCRTTSEFEALDMAKRVVHDEGARTVAECVAGLARGLAAHRRVFTLVVSLSVDTTRLPHAYGHGVSFRR